MILLVIVGLVGAAAFILLMKLYWSKNPVPVGGVAGIAVIALVAALVILAASGRLHWLAALATGMLPFLRQVLRFALNPISGFLLRRFLAGRGGGAFRGPFSSPGAAPAAGGAPSESRVATEDLAMTLDHGSGRIGGEVLRGAMRGRRLDDLGLDEVRSLYAELADEQSRQLLGAYLDQRAPGWSGSGDGAGDSGRMTRERALQVLGLDPGAGDDEVIAAHRRLMQRLHPDRGGTDFLAATLNEAKDVLLGGGGS